MKQDRMKEVLRFAITGGVCFLVEEAALILLVDTVGMSTPIAVPLAFLVSVIVNYLLCLRWVFHADKQGHAARIGFLVTSVLGLVWNELLMLVFRAMFGEAQVLMTIASFSVKMYMINKVIATLVVMVWNYFTKRTIMNGKLLQRWTNSGKGQNK